MTPPAAVTQFEEDLSEQNSAAKEPKVIGLSFRTADLALRSKLGFTPSQQAQAVLALREQGVGECMVLSTCNRAEIYFSGACFHPVMEYLAERAGISQAELLPHVYQKSGTPAVAHLFRVTAGLDSAVVGETEILAQFKEAWRIAASHRATGRLLELVCRSALEASKRIRTETAICKGVTSVGSLAVREAAKSGPLKDKSAILIGAGKIAERVAKELAHVGVGRLVILNRTVDNARRLADQHGGQALGLDALEAELAGADVVFAAAATSTPIITAEMLRTSTPGRSLVLVDLGVPRNIDPACAGIAGVEAVDMEGLAERCHANSKSRAAALPHATEILEEEIRKYEEAMVRREASSTIGALVGKAEEVRRRNLDWALPRLADLDDKERKVVEDLTMRIVKGLLESPIAELKETLTEPHQREIVARLFGLEAASNGKHHHNTRLASWNPRKQARHGPGDQNARASPGSPPWARSRDRADPHQRRPGRPRAAWRVRSGNPASTA